MSERRTVDVVERRARLAWRHHLAVAAQVPDPVRVAESIAAYHATEPASVYLAAAARTGFADPGILDKALYDDRTLMRMLGMRRTMFVVPVGLVPVVQAACTDAIAAKERQRTLQLVTEGGVAGDPEAWLATAAADTVRALAARGEATTAELSEDVPALRAQVVLAKGKPYESTATMAPRVLFQLSAEGTVVRGRPVKSWASNYRWALLSSWLPDGAGRAPAGTSTGPAGAAAPAAGAREPSGAEAEQARAQLARVWLAGFGPGTVADLKWWAGWTVRQARQALAAVGAVEVTLDGGEVGYVLPADLDPVEPPAPSAALLPTLDPAVMGWAMPGRDWYLPPDFHAALYDRSGNIGPTVWWDHHVVGGWAQRADGMVAYRLLADIGRDGQAAVAQAAGRLEDWLGDVRVIPRFHTPLEKELTA